MGAADRALRCLGCACEVACGAPGRRRRGQEPHLWRPLHQAGLRASPGLSPAPIPGSKAPFLTHPSCKLVSFFPCFPLVLLRAVWLVSLSSGRGGISQGEGWWCLTPWLVSRRGESQVFKESAPLQRSNPAVQQVAWLGRADSLEEKRRPWGSGKSQGRECVHGVVGGEGWGSAGPGCQL